MGFVAEFRGCLRRNASIHVPMSPSGYRTGGGLGRGSQGGGLAEAAIGPDICPQLSSSRNRSIAAMTMRRGDEGGGWMDGRGCFGPLEAQEVRRGPNDPRRIRRGSDLLSLQKLGARARHPGTTARSARVNIHGGHVRLRPGVDGRLQRAVPRRRRREREGGSEGWREGKGSERERGGESPTTPQRHPGARGGDGRGRYGYNEASRTYTKAWPAEYDDLWYDGMPVPHCRRHRRSSSSVGCFGRAVRYVGGAWPSCRARPS